MDPQAEPTFQPPAERIGVRISDPGEIAASLPQLLGFRPRESVVLVSLTRPDGGRVGLTVRADIPPAEHAPELARVLTRSVCTDRPRGVLVAVVSEEPDRVRPTPDIPHRALAGELVKALAGVGVPVPELLFVRGGRWWSYDCSHPCCDPGAGTALPSGVTELEVAAVATGTVVEEDREDLVARIARPDARARNAMAAACTRMAAECSAAVLETGWRAVAAESWSAVTGALERFRPGVPGGLSGGGAPLTDREVARIVCGLRDRAVRDRALELALGADAPVTEQLWTECTRRAPAPLDAAPATLLAVSTWLRGDGAMANVALARALGSDPGYTLARLLSQALARCLPPSELRILIRSSVDSLDDGPWSS
jgi:hypothetical protein